MSKRYKYVFNLPSDSVLEERVLKKLGGKFKHSKNITLGNIGEISISLRITHSFVYSKFKCTLLANSFLLSALSPELKLLNTLEVEECKDYAINFLYLSFEIPFEVLELVNSDSVENDTENFKSPEYAKELVDLDTYLDKVANSLSSCIKYLEKHAIQAQIFCTS